MTVPLDYADPSGPTIAIAVARLPASAAHPAGSIVVESGRPRRIRHRLSRGGGRAGSRPARHHTTSSRSTRAGQDAASRHDAWRRQISTRISRSIPLNTSAANQQAIVTLSQRFADGCLAKNGRRLLFLGTQYVARDLEELRRALGEPKLTYLGLSYGTYLGEVYASLYPQNVRAMVLDGVENPSLPLLTESEDQATAFEGDLTDFEAGCARGCGFTGSPAATIAQVLARAAADPLRVDGRALTRGEALTGILTYLYEPAE